LLRGLFRHHMAALEEAAVISKLTTTWLSEWRAIFSKARQYQRISWEPEQSLAFSRYWNHTYGKRISNRWHRLYESHHGQFHPEYVPEPIYATRVEPKLNRFSYARVLADKSLTELLYGGYPGVTFPRTVVVGANGYLYDESRNVISREEALTLLQDAGDIFIKPIVGGSSGRGVRHVRFVDGSDALSNASSDSILRKYGPDFIVQERLTQHESYAALHPDSINTVRITTYVSQDHVAHWPIALRMGIAGNTVDNIHAGGVFVGVYDDGRLNPIAYDQEGRSYTQHPTSGTTFDNYVVPFVGEIIRAAYCLHGRTPHIGIVSWDFAVDAASNVVLIETNLWGQSIWIPQITHGKPAFGADTDKILTLGSTSRRRPRP